MTTYSIKRSGIGLSAYVEKQVPFAMSKAINETLQTIQDRQRGGNGPLRRGRTHPNEQQDDDDCQRFHGLALHARGSGRLCHQFGPFSVQTVLTCTLVVL